MPKQPKLNDMQLVMLSTAAQREDGNFFPVAESLKGGASRIGKAIEGLISRGYAAEGEVGLTVPHWREDGDKRIGAAITAEGRTAIDGGEPEDRNAKEGAAPTAPPSALPASAAPPRKPGEIRAGTKQALLVEMLEREGGASIQQIVDATGRLPHTTRAALTGLKKRGFEVTKAKVDDVSRYHAKWPA
jgi:hypothetical protein